MGGAKALDHVSSTHLVQMLDSGAVALAKAPVPPPQLVRQLAARRLEVLALDQVLPLEGILAQVVEQPLPAQVLGIQVRPCARGAARRVVR